MALILPDAVADKDYDFAASFCSIERKLHLLKELYDSARVSEVELYLPKFKLTTEIDLKRVLYDVSKSLVGGSHPNRGQKYYLS